MMNFNDLEKERIIIFYDWLSKYLENDDNDNTLDEAQKRVLYDIECILEVKIDDIFSEDYAKVIMKAKNKILNDT